MTASGRELAPIVDGLGAWGLRWVGHLGDEDLDPHLLFWDMRRTVPVDRWPRDRSVLAFQLDDVAGKVAGWWMVVDGTSVDVCDFDPGYGVTATVRTSLRTLTRIWRGDVSWAQALRTGQLEVAGPEAVRRAVPAWVGQSSLADVARPALAPAEVG